MSNNYKEFLESIIDDINMLCTYNPHYLGGMDFEDHGRYVLRGDVDDIKRRIKDFINNMEN